MVRILSQEDRCFWQLVKKMAVYAPNLNRERLRSAYLLAKESHAGQRRKTGEPYIIHPLFIADFLVHLKLDEESIIVALLHDVVEDTNVTIATIRKMFGSVVARLVDGLTKMSKVYYRNQMEERQVASLRKLFLAMGKDVRVIIIKLVDRLHNMMTLEGVDNEKRLRIAKETWEIYTPIANLLGIWDICSLLRDYCFRYLNPDAYQTLQAKYGSRAKVEQVAKPILKRLRHLINVENNLPASINMEYENYYQIYSTMMQKGDMYNEIFDLFHFKIVTQSVSDCYKILGLIHSKWTPKMGIFADYIAIPRHNGYQALHTTCFYHKNLIQFHIKTEQMEMESRIGILAKMDLRRNEQRWIRDLLKLQKQNQSNADFLRELKFDLFSDRIFVFTPKGDLIDLPKKATPVDFAYAIHTELGNSLVGAKINGEYEPVTRLLRVNDTVEVLTDSQSPGPDIDWLDFVVTSKARESIKNYWHEKSHARRIAYGKEKLDRVLKSMLCRNLEDSWGEVQKFFEEHKDTFANRGLVTLDDFFIAIGEGEIHRLDVLNQMYNTKEIIAKGCVPEHNLFRVTIVITGDNTAGILRKVLQKLNLMGAEIFHTTAGVNEDDRRFTAHLEIGIHSFDELYTIVENLRTIPEVEDVVRKD